MLPKLTLLFLSGCLLLCVSSIRGEVCVGPLPDLSHDIEGQLCIIDQKTLVIRDFGYDGSGPAAYLYYYGEGFNVDNIPDTGGGEIIPYPETLGRIPSGRVSGIDLQFTLPEDVYACDMAVFTIWCDAANVHFTSIDIPPDIFSTTIEDGKILCTRMGGDGVLSFENCEQLDNSLNLAWIVDREARNVTFMLCGCTFADIEDNTWLGFGLSGSDTQTIMRGADVSIVWVDEVDGPHAEDYHLSEYTQCRGGVGACPDTLDSSEACSNDVTLIQGFRQDGQQCVVFSRNFDAGDECDLELDPDNEEQYIVWGIGGLGETAFRHFIRAERDDAPFHLGRASSKSCVPLSCSTCQAYQNQRIAVSTSATFIARIGPSGDQRGYAAITGLPGWGIAWYINDTLIPELVVQRGQNYTFIVYGGDDPSKSASYHPFYITSSESGGRALNTEEQRENETVYAGLDGEIPLGVGTLCEYDSNIMAEALEDNCASQLCHYEAALTPPDCDESATTANYFTWTPNDTTPDLVYYQCVTHQNLGWKIRVTDSVEDYVAENSFPETPSVCPELPTVETDASVSLSGSILVSLLLINIIAILFY